MRPSIACALLLVASTAQAQYVSGFTQNGRTFSGNLGPSGGVITDNYGNSTYIGISPPIEYRPPAVNRTELMIMEDGLRARRQQMFSDPPRPYTPEPAYQSGQSWAPDRVPLGSAEYLIQERDRIYNETFRKYGLPEPYPAAGAASAGTAPPRTSARASGPARRPVKPRPAPTRKRAG